MNRRGFLTGLGALVGGVLIDQAIPLNRVWSFPKNIVIKPALDEINETTLRYIVPTVMDSVFVNSPLMAYLKMHVVTYDGLFEERKIVSP